MSPLGGAKKICLKDKDDQNSSELDSIDNDEDEAPNRLLTCNYNTKAAKLVKEKEYV